MFIISAILSFMIPLPNNVVYKPFVSPRSKLFLDTDLIHSLEPPSGGSLKLLTHLNAASWSYNWLIYISDPDTPEFEEHYYMDYFNMRGVCNMYTNANFFYLGYFPDHMTCNEGPMYIALFELLHSKRIFNCKIIIENPHYIMYNSTLRDFKEEIMYLTSTANVFLKYKDLKREGQLRYYLDWNYEIN